MDLSQASYLAADRFRAYASGEDLPQTAEGSVLFADISGFTPLTERLRAVFGVRRGAETLATALNRLYDALVAEVDQYGGSIIGFAGDALTCWFTGENAAARATACGFALLEAMRSVEHVPLPEGDSITLGLKVAITTGTTRRFLVGDSDIQRIDALAGTVVARVAIGEELANRGELLVDAATWEQITSLVQPGEWREADGERFALLDRLIAPVEPTPHRFPENVTQGDVRLFSAMMPVFARDLPSGLDEFQIELRPVTALFLQFTGIDYDCDPDAEEKLDRFIQRVQRTVTEYGGNVLQLTIGDKGSYLYAAFGAPYAHEDDSARALSAAVAIREQSALFDFLDPIRIGISQGIVRTGTYGGRTRRTYGALGDEVNLAARLMQRAESGMILISEAVLGGKLEGFALQSLEPLQVKGKTQPVRVFQVVGEQDRSFEERFYTTPLVGRDDVLARLQEAFQPLRSQQHAGVIYVHGEAGMGKSRLVFEAQQQLQTTTNLTWLIGQADQMNRVPLSAFTYFLRPYFGQRRERDSAFNLEAFDSVFHELLARSDEANRTELQILRSFLAGVIGLVIPGSPYERADEKLRTDNSIAAVKAWARAEARRQPLVIQLEDAQWLDASSVRAVQQLTYNMEGTPLGLVLTSRYNDDGTPLNIPNIYSVPQQNFDLNRLSDDGVRAVTSSVLKGAISERLARFIGQRAEGNPFFTEQLALDLKERGVLVEAEGIWDTQPDAAADVPSGVNAVLIARLDRLAAQVKAVVQTAAVLGREFEAVVLSRMLRDADLPAIQEAERESIWTALDELRYLFRHALLRDAAYNMQAQERLRALHQLAAETIEAVYSEDASQADALLEHWHATGNLDRELPYVDVVTKRLLDVDGRFRDAEQLLNRALSQLEAEDVRRIKLLNRLSVVFQNQGEFNEAVGPALQAQRIAEQANDTEGLSSSFFNQGMVLWRQSQYAEGRDYLERSLAIQRELGMQEGVANNLRELGNVAFSQGSYDEAQTYVQEALVISRAIENQRAVRSCLNSLGMIAQEQGRYAEARELWLQALTIAREIGDRANTASSLSNLGVLTLDAGVADEAQIYFEQALKLAREVGNRRSVAIALSNLGNVALEQGQFEEAHNYFEQALQYFREMGAQNYTTLALVMQGIVAVVQRQYSAARTYFEQTLPIQQQIGDRYGTGVSLGYLGVIAFHESDYLTAESYQQQALTIRRETQDHFLQSNLAWLARIQLRLGQVETAKASLREAVLISKSLLARQQLEVLLAAVEWHFADHRYEPGVELLGLIMRHPRADRETQVNASDLLEMARTYLDASMLEAALERGSVLELDRVIEQLLAELS